MLQAATVTLVLLLLAAAPASADPRLPAIFSDHMVLQQQMPIGVWGWAAPDERIEVRLRTQRVSTAAGRDGRWRVTLAPETAGGPDELVVAGATATKRFADVLVGEVWVGSGQSNMQWEVRQAQDADTEIAAANHPRIRLFSVKRVTALEPKDDVTPMDDAPTWTAAHAGEHPELLGGRLLLLARAAAARSNVPIGFIHSSWGGTPAEAWTRRDVLAEDPALQPLLAQYRRLEAEYPSQRYGYERRLPIWNDALKAWQAANPKPETPMPGMPAPRGGPEDPHRPASLWNAMIAPITPFAIRGMLWYQGETNALRAWDYQRLMTAMIQDWRRAWNAATCRSCSCSSPTSARTRRRPARRGGREVREAQRLTLGLPNTAMASAIDIGNPLDIHPLNKQEVGRRLALAARGRSLRRARRVRGAALRRHDDRRQPDPRPLPPCRSRAGAGHGQGLGLRRGRRRRRVQAGDSGRRRRHDRSVESGRRRAGGGALRVGGRSDHEPAQQGRPASVTVPDGYVLTVLTSTVSVDA